MFVFPMLFEIESSLALTGTVDLSLNNFSDSGVDVHFSVQCIGDEAIFGLSDCNYRDAGLAYDLEGFDLRLYYTDMDLNKTQCADGSDVRGVFCISQGY